MHDLVAGRYTLPWEASVKVTDGTGCGFEVPTRTYAPTDEKLSRGRGMNGAAPLAAAGETYVAAEPYPWPYDGALRPDNTALITIDMQVDFCGKGGYVDAMGYDLSLTQAPIAPINALMAAMRARGFTIIHTREGHRPDLGDLPANKPVALPPHRRRHRRPRPLWSRPSCAASRAGRSSRARAAAPARSSSTSLARVRSAPPTSS